MQIYPKFFYYNYLYSNLFVYSNKKGIFRNKKC